MQNLIIRILEHASELGLAWLPIGFLFREVGGNEGVIRKTLWTLEHEGRVQCRRDLGAPVRTAVALATCPLDDALLRQSPKLQKARARAAFGETPLCVPPAAIEIWDWKRRTTERARGGLEGQALLDLAETMIRRVIEVEPGIFEGRVMCSAGGPQYRRLDCGALALAYIRVRSRFHCVRVEISNLWQCPEGTPEIALERICTGLVFKLRDAREIEAVARHLAAVVETTRRVRAGKAAV